MIAARPYWMSWADLAEEQEAEIAELRRANRELQAGLVAALLWTAYRSDLARFASVLIEEKFSGVLPPTPCEAGACPCKAPYLAATA